MASGERRPRLLVELPADVVLDLIILHLDVASFMALCRTCKAFYASRFRHDINFWKAATQSTFRIAERPIKLADGVHWQSLYRKLLTNTRAYTWGDNSYDCLGQEDRDADRPLPPPRHGAPYARYRLHQPHRENMQCMHPTPMADKADLGIVADLQCGGWSTTLLTSKGALYSVGTFQGESVVTEKARYLTPLNYPYGFSHPADCYDPQTAIKQFSSGRAHVLGLSDSGNMWLWGSVLRPASNIVFAEREIPEKAAVGTTTSSCHRDQSISRWRGSVRKVVAGWSTSSAYINGVGIVLWAAPDSTWHVFDAQSPNFTVQDSVTIPRTSYIRPARSARDPDDATGQLGQTVGEVINYILLEHFVVLVTDLGRFFVAKITRTERPAIIHVDDIVELVDLRAEQGKGTATRVDIQGSFRSFAAFRHDGEVRTGTQHFLEAYWYSRTPDESPDELPDELPDPSNLKRIPALQNTGVISMAFGDYHYHALHSNGTITSYGTEPGGCGALGLGADEGRLRGIILKGSRDRSLDQHSYTTGRKIWFNAVASRWLKYLLTGGVDPTEAATRINMTLQNATASGEVGEWVEQQGSDWDRLDAIAAADEDGLGTHYALSVAAAGWHSGALVLVNDDLARDLEKSCMLDGKSKRVGDRRCVANAAQTTTDSRHHYAAVSSDVQYKWDGDRFPRLRLSNGEDMPGSDDAPFDQWKYPRPNFELDQNF